MGHHIKTRVKTCAALMFAGLCSIGPFDTQPVSAATMAFTFSGTIASGTDGASLFGDKDGDLSGKQFEARYIFDINVKDAPLYYRTGNVLQIWYSETALLFASMTVNGHWMATGEGNYLSQIDSYSFPQYTGLDVQTFRDASQWVNDQGLSRTYPVEMSNPPPADE